MRKKATTRRRSCLFTYILLGIDPDLPPITRTWLRLLERRHSPTAYPSSSRLLLSLLSLVNLIKKKNNIFYRISFFFFLFGMFKNAWDFVHLSSVSVCVRVNSSSTRLIVLSSVKCIDCGV